jgi:3-phenylpropionate/cinnamic acid dioxygenase small subunit
MSMLGDALNGVRQILLLQEQVKRLEAVGEKQRDATVRLTDDLIALDKRVVRIETMIEMTARQAPQPRIE